MFVTVEGGKFDGLHDFIDPRYASEWISKHLDGDADIWYSYDGKVFVSVYDFPYY